MGGRGVWAEARHGRRSSIDACPVPVPSCPGGHEEELGFTGPKVLLFLAPGTAREKETTLLRKCPWSPSRRGPWVATGSCTPRASPSTEVLLPAPHPPCTRPGRATHLQALPEPPLEARPSKPPGPAMGAKSSCSWALQVPPLRDPPAASTCAPPARQPGPLAATCWHYLIAQGTHRSQWGPPGVSGPHLAWKAIALLWQVQLTPQGHLGPQPPRKPSPVPTLGWWRCLLPQTLSHC